MSVAQELELTAIDVVEPGAGQAVVVLTGRVLAFVLIDDGRRLPLTALEEGQVAIACTPLPDGTRLLLTGLPGTRVELQDVNQLSLPRIEEWVLHLGEAITGGRRPRDISIITGVDSTVPAAETIGLDIDDKNGVLWVRVQSGCLNLCDGDDPSLTPDQPAIPVSRDMWLTAVGATEVNVSAATGDSFERRVAGIDLLGQMALASIARRQDKHDRAVAQRIMRGAEASHLAVRESVDVLASSVEGGLRIPSVGDEHTDARFAAAVLVARSDGLIVDDRTLQRAAQEVESGRDAVTAVADGCAARARMVTLDPEWRTRESRALIAEMAVDEADAASDHDDHDDPSDHDDHEDHDDHGPHRHVVALVWRRGGWMCVDPMSGDSTPVDDALDARLSREVNELVPVLPTRPSTLRDLGALAFRGNGRDFAAVAVVTALVGLSSFFVPYLLGQLATLFTSEAPPSAFAALFGALILVAIAGATWQLVRSRSMLRIRSRSVGVAAGALWERAMRQPASWHDRHTLGDRMAQTNAVSGASVAFSDDVLARLLDTVVVVGTLVAVATTSGPLLLTLLGLIIGQILIVLVLVRKSSARATARIDASAKATGRLIEVMRAVNRIRVAGAESRVFLRWAQIQAEFTRADQSLRRLSMVQGVVIAVWPVFSLLVIVAVSYLSNASFGAFITAQTASAISSAAVAAASVAASSALIARRNLAKAEPLLESIPESGADGTQPGLLSGGIETRDLVYRYAPNLSPVLDGVSIDVKPGEHVAIVGPSGCGKTTLMRAILGLANPESGVILVDNKDMNSLNRPAVRRQIGSVLQSSQLLPGPLRQNVDMGRGLTTAEIWEALDAASVGADVRAMPMGLDTPISDGAGTISGGQRQRILIARALAGNPRMLVLDEATSALDNITQAAVVESLQNLRLTRIVVAHRLSTIREADRIIVMDAGKVVDEGTYDELYAKPGPFRELALRQQA